MQITTTSQFVTPLNPASASLSGVFATLLVHTLSLRLADPIPVEALFAPDPEPRPTAGALHVYPPALSSFKRYLHGFSKVPLLSHYRTDLIALAWWSPSLWPTPDQFESASMACPIAFVSHQPPFPARYFSETKSRLTTRSFCPFAIASTAVPWQDPDVDPAKAQAFVFFLAFPSAIAYYPALDDSAERLGWIRDAGFSILD